MPRTSVDTARVRRRIEQLVHNEMPACEVAFEPSRGDGSLEFRIRAPSGRYRTKVIRLTPYQTGAIFNGRWLKRQIAAAPPD